MIMSEKVKLINAIRTIGNKHYNELANLSISSPVNDGIFFCFEYYAEDFCNPIPQTSDTTIRLTKDGWARFIISDDGSAFNLEYLDDYELLCILEKLRVQDYLDFISNCQDIRTKYVDEFMDCVED